MDGRLILVVEDDAEMAELLRDFLSRVGYNVIVVHTGSAALAACTGATPAKPPDLVVCDVMMNEMNGIELTRKLLATIPSLPIILFSAYADLALRDEARRAGARRLLSKPFGLAVMAAAVREELIRK